MIFFGGVGGERPVLILGLVDADLQTLRAERTVTAGVGDPFDCDVVIFLEKDHATLVAKLAESGLRMPRKRSAALAAIKDVEDAETPP